MQKIAQAIPGMVPIFSEGLHSMAYFPLGKRTNDGPHKGFTGVRGRKRSLKKGSIREVKKKGRKLRACRVEPRARRGIFQIPPAYPRIPGMGHLRSQEPYHA